MAFSPLFTASLKMSAKALNLNAYQVTQQTVRTTYIVHRAVISDLVSLSRHPFVVLKGQGSWPWLLPKPVHVSAKLLDGGQGFIILETQLANLRVIYIHPKERRVM